MIKKSFKQKIKYIIAISVLMTTMISTFSLATSSLGTSTTDVTPPRGRMAVVGATQINNINYIDSSKVKVEISAMDDTCDYEEIKYYLSLEPISKTTEIASGDWIPYSLGTTEEITLTNLQGVNTIYLALKDAVGNISLIYSDKSMQYTIEYNKNAEDATMFTSTVGTTAYHGMSFIVTSQVPTREDYYFVGWSTNPNATTASYKKGEAIPADAFVGGSKTIKLYAVWAKSSNGLVLLSDVAEIGDYVSYPVHYDNINTYPASGTSYISSYNGWRVISKDVDLDGKTSIGTVNLVSAGTPLTFYHYNNQTTGVTALTTNFLTTELNDAGQYTYRNTGFLYKTLTETFTNKYTAMKSDGVTPQVRAMTLADIRTAAGDSTIDYGSYVNNAKYEDLFHNGSYYWLATAYPSGSAGLYHVSGGNGNVGYNSNSLERGVRPVVSLKSNIVVTGTDMVGAWNIELAE